jgi:gamma-glutamyl-gamma-aminobutyrate hydrolase PuuD
MDCLILGDGLYKEMFLSWGWNTEPKYNKDVKLVCFTGGNDIDPSLYGEKRIGATDYPMMSRDDVEVNMYKYCVKDGVAMVGICRG